GQGPRTPEGGDVSAVNEGLPIARVLGRRPATNLRRNPAAPWRHLDVVLVGALFALSAVGVLMVYAATRGPGGDEPLDTSFLKRQALFVLIGVAVMAVTALIDYRRYRDWAPVLYGGGVVLLALVLSPLGSARKGTQAWFELSIFQLQPSEFAKLGVIVGLAALIAQYRWEIGLRRLLLCLLVAGVPLALIMVQPDLGTGLVIIAVAAGGLLVGGASFRQLGAIVLFGALASVAILQTDVLEDYQRARLTSFLDQSSDLQGASYNQNQSQIAIGAGAITGKGLFQGTQTRLRNVPEQHTDFIFTAVGEELGLMGTATLLALFGIIVFRIWRTAQLSRDPFGTILCVGVLSMLLFQIFQNVGMTMGIMPITGIPLPFVSYGGSSAITHFCAMGLVLNVHMRRFS
ncbi:MAG: rod shape-determining protein RodA, partial [Acidimicrobiales bacterium]